MYFDGYWNQTFPTKDKLGHLDGFKVVVTTDVDVSLFKLIFKTK